MTSKELKGSPQDTPVVPSLSDEEILEMNLNEWERINEMIIEENIEDYIPLFWEDKILYNSIEQKIIKWTTDGTKTAGQLTREIMECIEEGMTLLRETI